MTIAINFFGGAGAGKSTISAATFAKLKYIDINCELVTEYAKDRVWNQDLFTLSNQIYVFGKQHHRMFRVKDKVDVIVTDSPFLLSLIYGKDMSKSFENLVLEEFYKFDNVNIFLRRIKRYQPIGRLQTEDEAKTVDTSVKTMLDKYGISYHEIIATTSTADEVLTLVSEKLAQV